MKQQSTQFSNLNSDLTLKKYQIQTSKSFKIQIIIKKIPYSFLETIIK